MCALLRSEINIIHDHDLDSRNEIRPKFESIFKQSPIICSNKLGVSFSESTGHIENQELHIFIHGDIYEGTSIFDSIQDLFDQNVNPSADVLHLNGSFIIVAIQKATEKILIITDRINSRRLYFFKKDGKIVMTTNPRYFQFIDNEINYGGIASYLINGVVYNNNTLYRNIMALDRAGMYVIENDTIKSRIYWQYSFTDEYADFSKDELKKKFAGFLLQSVNRRLISVKPKSCFISLSGGYDSRFLLGAMRELKPGCDIRTFSYGTADKYEGGDDIIAAQLAEKFNIKHHFEPAYTHNILTTISLNVEYGFGFSNFCDEVDAWLGLSTIFQANPGSMLFVGDMFYHSSFDFHNVKDKRLPLIPIQVLPWYYISPLLKVLPAENAAKLTDGYDEIYKSIIDRLPDTNDFKVIKDFAYLDQRISHTLIYWREFFQSPFINVTQPLLDNDILDYVSKLPEGFRYRKSLYKETLHDMFPDLFEIPIAKNFWVHPSWMEEIEKYRELIFERIHSKRSYLDELIPPETIISLINHTASHGFETKNDTLYLAVKKISSKHNILNNLLGDLSLKLNQIKGNVLIIRILVLREALEY